MLEMIKERLPQLAEEADVHKKFKGGFIQDFAEARQIATDAAKNDLIFWIDSDDVLEGGAHLRQIVAQIFDQPQDEQHRRGGIFMLYKYWFDPDGACVTELWRERIVDRRYWTWKGACHESLIPKDPSRSVAVRVRPDDAVIRHEHASTQTQASDMRNYVILHRVLEEAQAKGEWIDPRWIFYLGNACRGMMLLSEAVKWFSITLERSGSKEDRFACACNNGMIYGMQGRHWRALDWFWQASKIYPQEPRAYFQIANAYHHLGMHQECVWWTEVGRTLPKPDRVGGAADPQGFDFYPTIFECLSLREMGKWEEAISMAKMAAQLRPNFPEAQELVQECEGLYHNELLKQSVMRTCQLAASAESAEKIITNLKPEIRKAFPELQIEKVVRVKKPSITYLCGPTVEPWDGTSRGDGIGGSEKMVLQLAKEWVKKGWAVDVYGNPKDENRYKKIDGIHWRPYQCFNPAIERDVLILWRQHAYLDLPLKARKIFVDLHDVQEKTAFIPPRQGKVDGYIFKSQFHASNVVPCIHPDKLIISRNGIDLRDFDQKAERNYKKVVFCSSADRGLLGLLKTWRRFALDVPDAQLDIFYGFTKLYMARAREVTYQHFWDEGCDRHMLDYMEQCLSMIEKMPNVQFHGRVSHDVMAKHLLEAGAWCYPTGFPEISCMAAMEAQIAGAMPVAFPTGALAETVKNGFLVENYDGVIKALKEIWAKGKDFDDYRAKMSNEARQAFNIETLADVWLTYFK